MPRAWRRDAFPRELSRTAAIAAALIAPQRRESRRRREWPARALPHRRRHDTPRAVPRCLARSADIGDDDPRPYRLASAATALWLASR